MKNQEKNNNLKPNILLLCESLYMPIIEIVIYMTDLEKAIYTIAYYWHGIDRHTMLGVIWFIDKLHNLELVSWSNINNYPFSQIVIDTIDEMVTAGHLRLTDRWVSKFGNLGFEPIQNKNFSKLFKLFDNFSFDFRLIINFFITEKKIQEKFILYENNSINKDTFYKDNKDEIYTKIKIKPTKIKTKKDKKTKKIKK